MSTEKEKKQYRIRSKKYYKRHKDKKKEYAKKYYLENRLDILKKTSQHRLKIRFEIFNRDNFTCQYCGRKSPEVIIEIDHIVPQSKEGKDELNNYITACKDCNMGKSNLII